MFSYGVDSPPQETQETQLGFYLKRLLLLDPFLLAAALAALIWKRPRLLLIWILVVFAAALAFQYRNDAYLLPMYSALAILAASAIPGASPASATSPTPVMKTRRNWATGFAILACLVFAGKVIASAQPWGIPFKPESVNPSLAALDRYAALHRGNDLLVVEPDDDFYSADIGLPHVRYVWVDPNPPRHFPLDFQYLGILISAADYSRLPELQPQFEQRLREWNLNSSDPIPTSILARNRDELAELIRTHPMADFFLTTDWIAGDQAVHQARRARVSAITQRNSAALIRCRDQGSTESPPSRTPLRSGPRLRVQFPSPTRL
jgi:hypothetical protein